MDIKEIKKISELMNGDCSETKCEDCEYREKEIGRPYTCRLDEEEALSEAVRIIEEQEERIAIMEEGGWHKITESIESLPKETDSVDVWVYGEDENGKSIVFRAIYSRWHFYDVSGRFIKECKITHWMYNKEPEPPKEGESG